MLEVDMVFFGIQSWSLENTFLSDVFNVDKEQDKA